MICACHPHEGLIRRVQSHQRLHVDGALLRYPPRSSHLGHRRLPALGGYTQTLLALEKPLPRGNV
eukprot:6573524-Prorocentrum_lima.AAC.1